MNVKLSNELVDHLLYLGIKSVNVKDNKVVDYDLRGDVLKCNLTNREVELIIRTWKCCESVIRNSN